MAGGLVAVRSWRDPEDSAYPIPSRSGSQWVVRLEGDDGVVAPFVANGLTERHGVSGGRPMEVSDVSLEVLVTDARVAFGCVNFDKGGGWFGIGGGALLAMFANGFSKAGAAWRRRGKALVGHVRYDDLVAVGGVSRTSGSPREALRLVLGQGEPMKVTASIELKIDKAIDSHRIAQEIARRAARWRLRDDLVTGADEAALVEMLAAPKLTSISGEFAMHALRGPSYPATNVPEESDRPGQA